MKKQTKKVLIYLLGVVVSLVLMSFLLKYYLLCDWPSAIIFAGIGTALLFKCVLIAMYVFKQKGPPEGPSFIIDFKLII